MFSSFEIPARAVLASWLNRPFSGLRRMVRAAVIIEDASCPPVEDRFFFRSRMDLQMERKLEQFLQLLELPCSRIGPRLEFVQPPMRVFIEAVGARLVLSLARPVDPARRDDALRSLVARCDPVRHGGLILRACALRRDLMLSCTLDAALDVAAWLQAHRTLRRLLDAHAGDAR
jgi:type III secretion system chaperone SycN